MIVVMKAHRPFPGHANDVSRRGVDEGKVGDGGGQWEEEQQTDDGALLSKKHFFFVQDAEIHIFSIYYF